MRQQPAADVTARVKAGMCGIHLGILTATSPATKAEPQGAESAVQLQDLRQI